MSRRHVTATRSVPTALPVEEKVAPAPPAGPASEADRQPIPRRLVLVGNPNVGKSVVFGLLTGHYVTVSNYPGTTVEVTRGTLRRGEHDVTVIDTPGVNTLIPQSEDERVTRDILLHEADVLVQVGDTRNLPRALMLTLQIAELGLPFGVCLNMRDEADQRGIQVDIDALSGSLGVPVVSTVATRRQGVADLRRAISEARPSPFTARRIRYDEAIEEAIRVIEPLMPHGRIARRALALMVIAGDESISSWLLSQLDADALGRIEDARRAARARGGNAIATRIMRRRMQDAAALAQQVTRRDAAPSPRGAAARVRESIARATMHPVLGFGVLGLVLYLMWALVGGFGAGTAVDFLETDLFGQHLAQMEIAAGPDGPQPRAVTPETAHRIVFLDAADRDDGTFAITLRAESRSGETGAWLGEEGAALRTHAPGGADAPRVEPVGDGVHRLVFEAPPATALEIHMWTGWLNPVLHGLFLTWVPWGLLRDLFVGPYGLLTMGLTYAIAIVLPIVATFFFAFSVLEDSGYLPRLAIMLNKIFRAMGLNGKAVLPMVLGLGCDTMATLTTRILETRKERTIVILLLALGVPCSAQLGVILGMLAGLSAAAALVWAGVVAGVVLLVGFLASRIIPGRGSEFIMEIPPLRIPSPRNLLSKTLARVEWYLKEAVPLFLLGTLVLFVADRTRLLEAAERALAPVVTGALSLPGQATEAFLIGFLRRDFGAAGLYRLAQEGALDAVQVVVALVTITLFIPCIANFFMIIKEQGLRIALLVAAFIFPFALIVGALLNGALRVAGVAL